MGVPGQFGPRESTPHVCVVAGTPFRAIGTSLCIIYRQLSRHAQWPMRNSGRIGSFAIASSARTGSTSTCNLPVTRVGLSARRWVLQHVLRPLRPFVSFSGFTGHTPVSPSRLVSLGGEGRLGGGNEIAPTVNNGRPPRLSLFATNQGRL